MFGNPETTPGGLALKFFSSVRLDVRKVTGIKDGEETIGSRVKAKVVKNKVAPPFRQAEFDLMHDRGISREGDLIDLAHRGQDHREERRLALSYGEIRLGNGRENVKQYLRDNPALVDEISRKVLEKRGLTSPAAAAGRRERPGGGGQAGADGPQGVAPPGRRGGVKSSGNKKRRRRQVAGARPLLLGNGSSITRRQRQSPKLHRAVVALQEDGTRHCPRRCPAPRPSRRGLSAGR